MASPIRQLLNFMTDAIEKLEQTVDQTKTSIPDLYSPFVPQSEAFRANPDIVECVNIICAASSQLEAILMPPHISLSNAAAGFMTSATLRVCLESNVTEILREAGPNGLHVDEIAAKNGQNPQKLARFLRFLATRHIYRELKPNVFTNTRISSMLDTLKPSQDIIDHLDESFKASAYAWETLSDPAVVNSSGRTVSPFSRAFNTKETYWDVIAREEFRSRRFNIAMQGVKVMQPVDAILKAYEWSKLPAGSTIVDVGGGIGFESLTLARQFPSLKFVVQDLPSVIESAKKYWQQNLPDAQVTLEVHDFFVPQPADREIAVFLLKQVLHDWPDEHCSKILAQLRAVAQKDTKLLLIESLIPFACRDPNDGASALDFQGFVGSEAPAPLLANYGTVNGMGYNTDINVSSFLHCAVRPSHSMRKHPNRCFFSLILKSVPSVISTISFLVLAGKSKRFTVKAVTVLSFSQLKRFPLFLGSDIATYIKY
ncbi:hypothetical protein C0995_012237 [Termitomyces sp. Mi166|nr:hypothetical protein C0995_012237 [Termitomyces sp. Mi166\